MKKYLTYILAVWFATSSCSLDENMYVYIDGDTYIEDAASARTVLYGLYRDMSSLHLYGLNLSIRFDMPTDIAKMDGNTLSNNRDFYYNAHLATNAVVQETWQALYRTIYSANDFIEKTNAAKDRISQTDAQAVAVYVAEARVIRALMYFELVRNWKNVSLITSVAQSRKHASTFMQEKPETVYEFIEQELSEAAKVLPWATADTVRPDNAYMISKASALGLLARVYLTWAGYPMNNESKWELAKNACEEIINSGKHDLLADYEVLWKNSCNSVWDPKESLFEISFYTPTISSLNSNNCSGYIGKWNGVYVVENTSPLVRVDARCRSVATFGAKWPNAENDKRFYLSLADFYYEGTDLVGKNSETNRYYEESEVAGMKRVYGVNYGGQKVTILMARESTLTSNRDPFKNRLFIAKWDLTKYVDPTKHISDGNFSNANWYILRYSDILLMYAEAVNEISGPTDEAYDAVNKVRRRGYGFDWTTTEATVADLPDGLSQTDFRQAIWDERAYELCFEGQRKHDLIRWGIYADTVIETGAALEEWRETFSSYYLPATYTQKGKHELQPIPQRELDLMPLYKQNPNWEK